MKEIKKVVNLIKLTVHHEDNICMQLKLKLKRSTIIKKTLFKDDKTQAEKQGIFQSKLYVEDS